MILISNPAGALSIASMRGLRPGLFLALLALLGREGESSR